MKYRFLLFIGGGIAGIAVAKEYFFTFLDKIVWRMFINRIQTPSTDISIDPEQVTDSALFEKCVVAFCIGGLLSAYAIPAMLRSGFKTRK